jgi:hypothetical protein
MALKVICEWSPVGGRPYVATGEVYTTSQRRAERALGDEPVCPEGPVQARIEDAACPDGPVFVAAYHLTYRDYAGRWHRANDVAYVILLDARTLDPISLGPGALKVRTLGRPVALDF